MKVALCFYGQPRFYDLTYKLYYSKIIETFKPDVFIHTWWSEDMVGSLYPCAKHAEKNLSDDDRRVRKDLIEDLISIYKPKAIDFDGYETTKIKYKKPNHYQYYTQYAVKELLSKYEKDNGIEYDMVIRTRFDLLVQQPIPYHSDEFLWVSGKLPYDDRYNDLFSFSNSKNFKKISNTYLNLEEFEKEGKGEMEWAFTMQVIKENIQIKKFDAEYSTFDILRTKSADLFRNKNMDAILGCITKYKPEDIKPWVNSLNKSGFTGKRIMVVYDVPKETNEYLINEGFDVYQTEQQYHLFLQRFRDYYLILSDRKDINRVIHTDVKDVIFQANPSEWMDKYKTKPLIACSESIIIGDDDWAQKCAGTSFPMEWEAWLKYEESYCAGTILGDREYAKDLFLNIFRWALTGANPQEAADQPAYNCLIKQTQYKDCIQFVKQEEGLAVQLGTTLIKKSFFGDKLLEPTPLIKEDFTITNQKGEAFCIVHQYDRNPQLKEAIIKKFS